MYLTAYDHKTDQDLEEKFSGIWDGKVFKGMWYKDSKSQGVPFVLLSSLAKVIDSINFSGTYAIGFEDNISELEYNKNSGGTIIVQPDKNKLKFCLKYVWDQGRMAALNGIAMKIKNKDEYQYKQKLNGIDTPCNLLFVFSEGKLEIIQNSIGHICGFGVGADVSGIYIKQSFKTDMSECN